MTREELAREAYEWTEKNISVGISMYNPSIEMYCGKAYKDGAEPREKQIQIDAEQIRALQKQNGELTDKVKKLEAEVKEWKDKAELWCNTANLKDHNIMINKELEKENAKLKELLEACKQERIEALYRNEQYIKENAELNNFIMQCKKDGISPINALIIKNLGNQLIEAKEIIKNLLSAYTTYADSFDDRDNEIVEEAEQFLSEVEK